MKRTLILPAAFVVAAFLAIALPGAVVAAPPSNDDFANATVIDAASTSFGDTVGIGDASVEPNEPQWCSYSPQTVWYAVTPSTDETIRVGLAGSSFYDTQINVYRQDGSDITGLAFVSCASYYGNSTLFHAEAGKTYYLQAGNIYGGSGTLQLDFAVIPPPANDDFADASVISSLPFSDTVNGAAATLEPNEPAPSCGYSPQHGGVWYAYTAAETGSVSANGSYYETVAAYKGVDLAHLTEVGCRNYNSLLTFHVETGTTYYFQVASFTSETSLQFQLIKTPPPSVAIGYTPSDPNSFDTIQFYDQTNDPGQLGVQSWSWSFGDGGSSSTQNPSHRYLADGDYTVKLAVTTPDGRSGSTEQVVHVRTHDVAIAKLSVPQSASAGQTRSITVGISNKRYGETIQVQLFKSDPSSYNGYALVGTLQQSVPVRNGGRTTDFSFSYTFTSADKSLGKVTFKAVVSLVGARDALPADNEATALPTKVG